VVALDSDPDLLARWLGISGLIASAGDMLARQGGAWSRLALVAADAAGEGLLALLAEGGAKPLQEGARWEEVLAAASAPIDRGSTRVPPALAQKLRQAHRLRNMALHHGSEPGGTGVRRAIDAVIELRYLVSESSPLLAGINADGPIQAVARVVGVPDIADALNLASSLLRDGAVVPAADAGAIALEKTLQRVTPPLRPRMGVRLVGGRLRSMGGNPRQGVGPALEHVSELIQHQTRRSDLQEAWLLALGLGLRPNELDSLQETLGQPVYYVSGNTDVRRDPDVVLTATSVERALLQVADVVLRLSQLDGLRRDPV
jgi:hypothetical protein